MKLWFSYLIYGVVIIALESLWPVPGDFLLMAVICFGFYEEKIRGLGISLMLGYFLDVISYSPLGTSLVSYGLVYALIKLLRTTIFFRSLVSKMIWIAFFTFLAELFAFSWIRLVSDLEHSFTSWILPLLGNVVANALLGPFWLRFLKGYSNFSWNLSKTSLSSWNRG